MTFAFWQASWLAGLEIILSVKIFSAQSSWKFAQIKNFRCWLQ